MKKPIYVLYLVACLGLAAITWTFGNHDPVPSSHALAFLMHQDGVLMIIVSAITVLMAFYCVLGAIFQWDFVTGSKGIWAISIIFVFFVCGAFAYTRYAAGHDVNVSARYLIYMTTKGWSH